MDPLVLLEEEGSGSLRSSHGPAIRALSSCGEY